MKRLRIPALFLAILFLGLALWANRAGYALLPNAAALLAALFAIFVLRASGGSGGDR